MAPDNALASSENGDNTYVLAKRGEVYAIFNDRNGGPFTVDLEDATGTFKVQWFDPRSGTWHDGDDVQGGDSRNIGSAPSDANRDWAALVYNEGSLIAQ